jgi:hypothetical protein
VSVRRQRREARARACGLCADGAQHAAAGEASPLRVAERTVGAARDNPPAVNSRGGCFPPRVDSSAPATLHLTSGLQARCPFRRRFLGRTSAAGLADLARALVLSPRSGLPASVRIHSREGAYPLAPRARRRPKRISRQGAKNAKKAKKALCSSLALLASSLAP